MRRALVLAAVAALGALASAPPAAAAPDRIDTALVQGMLDRATAEGGIALGAQLRIVDGRQHVELRSGVARVGSSAPVPRNGRFRIGSVTKTFTATVVLQLVGEGRVALDAPVARYLPGLLPDGNRITVRMLLGHTSGLYDYTGQLRLDPAGFESIRLRRWDPRELVATAAARPLNFPPGSRYEYSNTNYVVAGLLVQRVTGQSWERAVEQRVLKPLKLRETYANPGAEIPGPNAHSYHLVDGRLVDITRSDASLFWAAGGMVSTTADLDRFFAALMRGELLRPAQLREMKATSGSYGLGLMVTRLPCGVDLWGHNGGVPLWATFVMASEDGRERLELSVNVNPVPGVDPGMGEVLAEVFC